MRGKLKLVITNGGRPELFDVEADPAERRNAIAEHPDLAKQLAAEVKAWLATEPKGLSRVGPPDRPKPKPSPGPPGYHVGRG